MEPFRFLCHVLLVWLVGAPSPLPLLFELLGTLDNQPPARILRVAAAARDARGPLGEALREVAALNPRHAERDLMRWVRKQAWRGLLPELYHFPLMKNTWQQGPQEMTHSVLLPHEVFGSLFTHAPELFHKLFVGEDLASWWAGEAASDPDWYSSHPVVTASPNPDHRIPLGLHGDDAGMHRQRPVTVVTWGPVAVKLPTLDTRIVFSALRAADVVPGVTLTTLFRVLVWSFECLASGKYPACDHEGRAFGRGYCYARALLAGKPIAGHYVGAWVEMRGDWKFLVESLALKQYYATNYCCHLCRAHKKITRLLFTDFRREAKHRRTKVDGAAWCREALLAAVISPLLFLPGFSIWRVWFDAMHVLDLGIYQSVIPSVMFELAAAGIFGLGTLARQFQTAYRRYRVWCRLRRVRAVITHTFDPRQWRKGPGAFPRISMVVAKAAEVRALASWLCQVCLENVQEGDQRSRLRALMMKSFVDVDAICRNAGRHLTEAQREQIAQYAETALLANNSLATLAAQAGQSLYKLLPKHHAFTHITFDARVNPRAVHCYQDEDMVGRVKRLFTKCHGTTAPQTVLERYSVIACLRWWEEIRVLRGIPDW